MRKVFPEAVVYAAIQASIQSLKNFLFTQRPHRRTMIFASLMVGYFHSLFFDFLRFSFHLDECRR